MSVETSTVPPKGILLAEGDSWFHYPGSDVLRELQRNHGWRVESEAHRGDTIEEMAYDVEQNRLRKNMIERAGDGEMPIAILVSGGGNDLAGSNMAMLLDFHHGFGGQLPREPGINQGILAGLIDRRLCQAWAFLLGNITEHVDRFVTHRPPIFIHGYDYPVPDGRGFRSGWGPLPGPWMRAAFEQKGYNEIADMKVFAAQMIDAYNAMLHSLVEKPGFEHVHYVDLRETLSSGSDYRVDWDNELHPSALGFAKIAAVVDKAVSLSTSVPHRGV